MLGFMIGSIVLFYLPKQPVLPMVLGALLVIVGILLFRRKITPQTAVFILGLAAVYALLSELDVRVLADDGGWQEGGGPFHLTPAVQVRPKVSKQASGPASSAPWAACSAAFSARVQCGGQCSPHGCQLLANTLVAKVVDGCQIRRQYGGQCWPRGYPDRS
jgi:hypothetical protein